MHLQNLVDLLGLEGLLDLLVLVHRLVRSGAGLFVADLDDAGAEAFEFFGDFLLEALFDNRAWRFAGAETDRPATSSPLSSRTGAAMQRRPFSLSSSRMDLALTLIRFWLDFGFEST